MAHGQELVDILKRRFFPQLIEQLENERIKKELESQRREKDDQQRVEFEKKMWSQVRKMDQFYEVFKFNPESEDNMQVIKLECCCGSKFEWPHTGKLLFNADGSIQAVDGTTEKRADEWREQHKTCPAHWRAKMKGDIFNKTEPDQQT